MRNLAKERNFLKSDLEIHEFYVVSPKIYTFDEMNNI